MVFIQLTKACIEWTRTSRALFHPVTSNMRSALKHLKKSDPVIAAIIRRVGPFAMQYREPSFETLVRSIVYQQLSGRVASVIFARLHAAAGEEQLTPAGIMKLRPEKMRKLGLSGAEDPLYPRTGQTHETGQHGL